jgi:FKBP-type peptidyl-prolyl cis-trans isomerase FkpA
MMNKFFKVVLFFFVLTNILACKDDESTSVYVVPYAEQEPIDNSAIIDFLTNNYFNEEDFISPVAGFNYNIEFSSDEFQGGYKRSALINYLNTNLNGFTIQTKTIDIDDVGHTLYVLKLQQGQGLAKPNFCDESLLSYEGLLLDNSIFDNALNPIKLDLSTTVRGFSESVSEFNTASTTIDNLDGTFTYNDYGVGAVFMPSALGYYQSGVSGISPYSPLIFKLKVFGATVLDHDNDGIPSFLEDLNGNNDLLDEDTDDDTIPNYLDNNDDGDPIMTIDEDVNADGDYSNDDTDNDGVPNYLDSDN